MNHEPFYQHACIEADALVLFNDGQRSNYTARTALASNSKKEEDSASEAGVSSSLNIPTSMSQ